MAELLAVRSLGHTAKLEEIDERVIEAEGFTDEQMSVLHKDGPRSEIEYRLAWARTYLKGMEALVNPSRGTWETTDRGKSLTENEVEPRWKSYLAKLAEERKRKKKAAQEAGLIRSLQRTTRQTKRMTGGKSCFRCC